MTPLPPPDQPGATAAAQAANKARDAAESALKDGTLDLAGLFAQVDAETGNPVIGHMHVKAALVALPGIGEVKAEAILAEVGVPAGEHLDVLGVNQRAALTEAVAAQ